MLDLPDKAKWLVHHRDCDPEPAGTDYWFDVGKADTAEKLLSRTAHLLGKRWLRYTDWQQFISRKAAA